ncbi:MAG: hypothetical protein B6D46_07140 [Polyangiaceae bacterium UTPRO1]|jgi:hypothetical protein|nr:MAG: hypothetical protein B6D46_07140 [Polyangiaceae bacterium UTPRO1]
MFRHDAANAGAAPRPVTAATRTRSGRDVSARRSDAIASSLALHRRHPAAGEPGYEAVVGVKSRSGSGGAARGAGLCGRGGDVAR